MYSVLLNCIQHFPNHNNSTFHRVTLRVMVKVWSSLAPGTPSSSLTPPRTASPSGLSCPLKAPLALWPRESFVTNLELDAYEHPLVIWLANKMNWQLQSCVCNMIMSSGQTQLTRCVRVHQISRPHKPSHSWRSSYQSESTHYLSRWPWAPWGRLSHPPGWDREQKNDYVRNRELKPNTCAY